MQRAAAARVSQMACAQKSMAAVARRFQHVSVATPIGKGRVVKLDFDSLKPAYVPVSWVTQFITLNSWVIGNLLPNMIIGFVLIFACHGGFSGQLPPDPRSLHP